MKYILILLLGATFLYACNPKAPQNIAGKYSNAFESNVVHYVELKPDSTFIHFYSRKNEPAQQNTGTWKLFNDGKEIEIMFNGWTDLGYQFMPMCDGCLKATKLENEKLIFNADHQAATSFSKAK